MEEYKELVLETLKSGQHRANRTAEDTISTFSQHYSIDLSEGYPLLTTKKMDNYRWDSMLHEFEWYLSGVHHIEELTNKTGIWDAWADDDMALPSAYGRFWRQYPIPSEDNQLPGEAWISSESPYTTESSEGNHTFDQLGFVVDALNGENAHRGPESRRLVVTAWHPSNAQVSGLPPCHFTFVFNVQGDKLNTHLTQRSADIALGVPFNIAAYSLLTQLVAQQTNLELGEFSHTLVDAHIYCGRDKRSEWYEDNLSELQSKLDNVEENTDYLEIRSWILENAPAEDYDTDEENHKYGYDHIPGLLEQLSRESFGRSNLEIRDGATIDTAKYDDFTLCNYKSHSGLRFAVAE